jgi:hypothetical protein
MASDPMAADIVLAGCLRWAKDVSPQSDRIDIAIPPEGHVFSSASYEGGVVLIINCRLGDFMARSLSTPRLLRQMQPEFDALTMASNPAFSGRLTFKTPEDDGSIFISRDGVSLDDQSGGSNLEVELSVGTLGALCLGAYETGDLLARLPRPPDARTVALLTMLFPRRYPHIYPLDRF